MVKSLKEIRYLLLCFGLCAALTSCSTAPEQPPALDPQRVWPPPPYQSSLKFLGVFSSENNFAEGPCDPESGQYEKLRHPLSSALLGGDRIIVAERTPADIKVIDFPQRKVYPLFNQTRPFSEPVDLAVDQNGNIYIADRKQQAVLIFSGDLQPLGKTGSELGLKSLEKIALDEAAGVLYLTDSFLNEVLAFDLAGTLLLRFGGGTLVNPHGLAIHPNGNIYVADTGNAKIRIFTSKGELQGDFPIGQQRYPSPLKNPWDLAFDPQGKLHIVDPALDLFLTCKDDGEILLATGSSKLGDNHLLGFNDPADIHIDQTNQIFIAERNNSRLSVWQLLTTPPPAGFFARFGKGLNLSCREYDPKQAADKSARRPSVFKVGDAQNVTMERVVQKAFAETRDAYQEALCLGSVKCKSCMSFNNIYVDTEHIEYVLARLHRGEGQTATDEIAAAEGAVTACRKCNRPLELSHLLKEQKIRFCLEPRELCPSKP